MAASKEIRCVRKSTLTWLFDQGPFQTETDRDKMQREKIREALLKTCAEERFVYLKCFYELVQQSTDASTNERELSGLDLMRRALQNVLKYSWNVLRHKDRKEYRTIKTYNGFYKCNVESLFSEAHVFFETMGFRLEGAALTLDHVDEERIKGVQVDLVFAQEELKNIYILLKMLKCARLIHAINARLQITVETDTNNLAKNFEAMAYLQQNKQPPIDNEPRDFINAQESLLVDNQGEEKQSLDKRLSVEEAENIAAELPRPSTPPRPNNLLLSGEIPDDFISRHAKPKLDDVDEDLYTSGVAHEDADGVTCNSDYNSLLKLRVAVNGETFDDDAEPYQSSLDPAYSPPSPKFEQHTFPDRASASSGGLQAEDVEHGRQLTPAAVVATSQLKNPSAFQTNEHGTAPHTGTSSRKEATGRESPEVHSTRHENSVHSTGDELENITKSLPTQRQVDSRQSARTAPVGGRQPGDTKSKVKSKHERLDVANGSGSRGVSHAAQPSREAKDIRPRWKCSRCKKMNDPVEKECSSCQTSKGRVFRSSNISTDL